MPHCHRGSTHFFVHSLAVLRNAALSFFNCCIQSQFRPASPFSVLATYRCYLRLKRIVRARIIHLFLDDRKYYSNYHTSFQCGRPVFLTCGECDGRLPLVSYPDTFAASQEVTTHLISQNRDAYATLIINPRMVNLGGKRYLEWITNVSRRAVIQSWNIQLVL
jgi:hypothetical protein